MTDTQETHPDTKPIDYQYEVALLAEECAEVQQITSKAFRFGWDSYHPSDPSTTNLDLLHLELGDVEAAIAFGVSRGLLDRSKLTKRKAEKLKKLKAIAPPTMFSRLHQVMSGPQGLSAKEEKAAGAVVLVLVLGLLTAVWFFASSHATKSIQSEASAAAVECFQTTPGAACDALQAIATR